MKFVLLEYLEHYASTDSAWCKISDLVEEENDSLPACGYLVGETASYIFLTTSMKEDEAVTPFKIHKGTILSRCSIDVEELVIFMNEQKGDA